MGVVFGSSLLETVLATNNAFRPKKPKRSSEAAVFFNIKKDLGAVDQNERPPPAASILLLGVGVSEFSSVVGPNWMDSSSRFRFIF